MIGFGIRKMSCQKDGGNNLVYLQVGEVGHHQEVGGRSPR